MSIKAVKCPVCEGRGFVPAGFYNPSGGSGTAVSTEKCRSCGGAGWVSVYDWDEAPSYTPASIVNKKYITDEHGNLVEVKADGTLKIEIGSLFSNMTVLEEKEMGQFTFALVNTKAGQAVGYTKDGRFIEYRG